MLRLILFYQRWLSPLFRPSCRFYPSCSHYAYQAISELGGGKGSYLALRRIVRCHPFHVGGYDPVPCKSASCCESTTDPAPHNTVPPTTTPSE